MEPSESPQLARLIALAAEADQILARSLGSHDIRHACAVARGYLDLARYYNEPVNVADVERVVERMRALSNTTDSTAEETHRWLIAAPAKEKRPRRRTGPRRS
jgi:hypothetical protein